MPTRPSSRSQIGLDVDFLFFLYMHNRSGLPPNANMRFEMDVRFMTGKGRRAERQRGRQAKQADRPTGRQTGRRTPKSVRRRDDDLRLQRHFRPISLLVVRRDAQLFRLCLSNTPRQPYPLPRNPSYVTRLSSVSRQEANEPASKQKQAARPPPPPRS